MRNALLWPAVVFGSAAAAMWVEAYEVGPPLAPVVALWFVLVCPGLPYVRLLDLRDPLKEAVLTVALSVSIQALVGLTLLVARVWTAGRMLLIVAAVAAAGACFDTLRVVMSLEEQEEHRRAV